MRLWCVCVMCRCVSSVVCGCAFVFVACAVFCMFCLRVVVVLSLCCVSCVWCACCVSRCGVFVFAFVVCCL